MVAAFRAHVFRQLGKRTSSPWWVYLWLVFASLRVCRSCFVCETHLHRWPWDGTRAILPKTTMETLGSFGAPSRGCPNLIFEVYCGFFYDSEWLVVISRSLQDILLWYIAGSLKLKVGLQLVIWPVVILENILTVIQTLDVFLSYSVEWCVLIFL